MTPNYGVELVGPFPGNSWRVVVDGYVLPYVDAESCDDGTWFFRVDNRMSIQVPNRAELERWCAIVGQAMAVAAGYPCLGAKEKLNRFACKLSAIESFSDKEKLS